MMSLYDEYVKICDFEMRGIEQLLGRADSVSDIACIARYKGSRSNAPPVADLDCSSANVSAVANDWFKICVVVVGKRTRPCPWLAASGAKLMRMHGDKKKCKVIQYQ